MFSLHENKYVYNIFRPIVKTTLQIKKYLKTDTIPANNIVLNTLKHACL